jgi:hypothetical protein
VAISRRKKEKDGNREGDEIHQGMQHDHNRSGITCNKTTMSFSEK